MATEQGRYSARQVVFACGAWLAQVLSEPRVEIRPERVQAFWLEPLEPELFELGRLPIYLWELPDGEHFYGFPHLDVARRQGCAPPHAGLRRSEHRRSAGHCSRRAAVARRDCRSLTRAQWSAALRLVCLYENSPDGHFLIDRLPDHANVLFAGGFSGHGFKFASVVGEILADLVTEGRATPDADFLKLRPLISV